MHARFANMASEWGCLIDPIRLLSDRHKVKRIALLSPLQNSSSNMSDGDVQALVVDNGSGMCKVRSRNQHSSSSSRRPSALCPVSQSTERFSRLPVHSKRQSPFECTGCHLAVHCDATLARCAAPLRCDTIPPLPSLVLLRSAFWRIPLTRPRHPFVCILFSLNCAPPPLPFSLLFSRPVSLEMMLPAPCSRRLSAARATKSVPRAHARHAQAEPNTRDGEPTLPTVVVAVASCSCSFPLRVLVLFLLLLCACRE